MPCLPAEDLKIITLQIAEIEQQYPQAIQQQPMDITHEGTVLKYSLGEGRHSWCQRYLQLVQGELHIRETPNAVKFKRLLVERIQSVYPLSRQRDGSFAINVTGGQATWI